MKIRKISSKKVYESKVILERLEKLNNLADNPNVGSQMLNNLSNRKDLIIWLAYFRNKIVGWCSVSKSFQVEIYVDAEYRSRGIASLLLKEAIKFSHSKNANLISYPWDIRGKNLYAKHRIFQARSDFEYFNSD